MNRAAQLAAIIPIAAVVPDNVFTNLTARLWPSPVSRQEALARAVAELFPDELRAPLPPEPKPEPPRGATEYMCAHDPSGKRPIAARDAEDAAERYAGGVVADMLSSLKPYPATMTVLVWTPGEEKPRALEVIVNVLIKTEVKRS